MNKNSPLQQQIDNIILIGKVFAIDYGAGKIRLTIGNLETNWLDWPAEIGRNFVRWSPVRIGTQYIVACPSGDISQAIIIGTKYSNDIQRPSISPNIDVVQYNDGTKIEYDSNAHKLDITVNGQTNISADVININGDSGDVVINNISLLNHRHQQNDGNDNGGGAITGPAQEPAQ